jgi:hypothetical protein
MLIAEFGERGRISNLGNKGVIAQFACGNGKGSQSRLGNDGTNMKIVTVILQPKSERKITDGASAGTERASHTFGELANNQRRIMSVRRIRFRKFIKELIQFFHIL